MARFKPRWAVFAALAAGMILIFDLTTKGFGFIDAIMARCCAKTFTPHVTLKAVPAGPFQSECAQFAFTDLPKSFQLEEIRLHLIKPAKLTGLPGEQAAEPLEVEVNGVIDETTLVGHRAPPITVRAKFLSERDGDSAYVVYCPIPRGAATQLEMVLAPKFFSPNGQEITKIVTIPAEDVGLKLVIRRPKNLVPKATQAYAKRRS